MAEDNPFAQPVVDDNPFKGAGTLEFVASPAPPPAPSSEAPPLPPKPVVEVPAPAPPRPRKDSAAVRSAQLDDRERQLDARERALNLREQQVTQEAAQAKEAAAAAAASSGGAVKAARAPNWPPKPWPKPFVHQDIRAEIPAGFRVVVSLFYIHWFYTLVILLYNLICCISVVVVTASAIGDVILAAIYLGVWGVVLCWLIFRVLYSAARKNKPLHWFLFFAVLVVQILVDAIALIGWERSGWVGIEYTIVMASDKHTTQCFMGLANIIVFGLSEAFLVYTFIHTFVAWKRAGGFKAASGQAAGIAVKAAADHPDVVFKAASAAAASSSASSPEGADHNWA